MGRFRVAARRIATGIVGGFVVITLLVGYGLDSDDARALNDFCDGVERWQTGPDFRHVSDEHVRLSHAATNASPWGIRATTLIMGIRSVPGLPPEYAVNPTSQLHYDNFARGELSAYLHLCGEQTMDWVVRDLHDIGTRGSRDADVESFLRSWKMNRPVAADAAAVAGIKRLLAEIDAAKPLDVRTQVQGDLEAAAAKLAARLGYSTDPRRMTAQQQRAVFERLDADLREREPELWRQKQVSDLCAGIWAQTFGRDYTMVIQPVLTVRNVARYAGPIGAAGMVVVIMRSKRRQRAARCDSPSPALVSG